MVLITFKKSYKIGSSHYPSIETWLYPPSTLCLILKYLEKEKEEVDNKKILRSAIDKCQYKIQKQKGIIYFSPALIVENELITHVYSNKISNSMIMTLVIAAEERCPENLDKLEPLIKLFQKRKEQEYQQKREGCSINNISVKSLPIKKRKL